MQELSSKTLEWLNSLGVKEVSNPELESGRIVSKVLKAIIPNYNLELHESNSAVNRMNNWNNLITELKGIGIVVNADDKTDIVNGNRELVYRILDKLEDLAVKSQNQKEIEVDLAKINPESNLADSSSLLELFILIIMKHFSLNPKEAVALLSSECKYLTHILVKGLKGDCKPVEAFINELAKHIDNINRFCKNKENEVFFIKAIKPALISKSEIAAERTIYLLSEFLEPLPNRFEIIKEHFITTVLLAIRRHPSIISTILEFLVDMTDFSKDILILLKGETTFEEMKEILSTIFVICKDKGQLNAFYSLKGLNSFMIKVVESIKNLEGLLSSMDFILLTIKDNTSILSDGDKKTNLVKYIEESILVKKCDRIMFVEQLFGLLEIFGQDKNHLAPSIFKILVLKYQNLIDDEESKLYIENFHQIVTEFPTIPYPLIVEVLNLRLENNTMTLTELELDFLRSISLSESLDIKTGLSIYNIASKVLIESPAFSPLCSDVLINVVRKLGEEEIVIDLSLKLVKVCLAIHFANTKRIVSRRKSVSGVNRNEFEDTIQKNKSICIEQFIYRLIKENVNDINRQSEPLICYSYIQVHNLSKESSAGLQKIVKLFGEESEVLQKYELEAKKLGEEEEKKESTQKSKIKEEAWDRGRYNELSGSNKHRSSSNHNRSEDTLKSKSSKLNPMLLSSSGVTSTALKGLEKYHQSYLSKVEKVQQEENKKKEEEDRQNFLRNVLQRKLLEKGIDVKKAKDEEFQNLYEFGVKEKEMEHDFVKNTVDLPLYISEEEEDRDNKALEYIIKKYQRILKLYYHIYSGHIKPQNLGSFDQIAQKINLLYSPNLWRMFKDHTLDEFISFKEVQYLSKKINQLLGKKFEDPTALDYEGFETFITQSSFTMFSRAPKNLTGRPISEMIEETISRLKLYASDNKINENLFEDPDNVFYNETEAIKELNKKLDNNSEYILPEGYKKIVEKKIHFTHSISIDTIHNSYKDTLEIVDDILNKALGVHVIEPFSTIETICKARPSLYFKQRNEGEIHSEKISSFMKKELSRMPIKDREIGKQAAIILGEIITAVEFGHDQTNQKHENKAVKEKKQQQEEKARKESEEKRKWLDRNKEIKSVLVKHKEVVEEKEKEEAEKKREEKNRKEEEIRKREEDLIKKKTRVESYQVKKKENEEKEKKDKEDLKRKEKEVFEKKRKELEESKRKVEEVKQIKEEELRQKKKEEKALEKEKKANELKKFELEQKKRKELLEEYKNRKIENQAMEESNVSIKIGDKLKQRISKAVDETLQSKESMD